MGLIWSVTLCLSDLLWNSGSALKLLLNVQLPPRRLTYVFATYFPRGNEKLRTFLVGLSVAVWSNHHIHISSLHASAKHAVSRIGVVWQRYGGPAWWYSETWRDIGSRRVTTTNELG